jgi:hypothetical protein
VKSEEERLKQWAQGKCYNPEDQGSKFCVAAEGMGLVSYEQSASQQIVTAIIVGVVAPDTEAWKGCFGEGKLSSCGSAALDLPIGKLFKGLKVTYKVINKVDKVCDLNSFAAGTLVLMGDGSSKPIEDVKAGDKVLATDPETGKTRIREVVAPRKHTGEKNLVRVSVDTDGRSGNETAELTVTAGHPFWVPDLGEWLDATDLIPGQSLSTSSGDRVRIEAVERWTEPFTVYNLTVDELHTYYVLAGETPVLVHNAGGDLTPEQRKAIGSYNELIAEHEQKLADYLADPDAYDNKGFLKNAPSDEVRQRIIDGRARHLRKEIQTFHENIAKIRGCG